MNNDVVGERKRKAQKKGSGQVTPSLTLWIQTT